MHSVPKVFQQMRVPHILSGWRGLGGVYPHESLQRVGKIVSVAEVEVAAQIHIQECFNVTRFLWVQLVVRKINQ